MTIETGHDWRVAGEAWGSHAADWSCLWEHYSIDVLVALFTRIPIGPSTRLLDVACGSGLTVRVAAATGARVAGIDAAEDLVAVARARTPSADLRVGSMYELPWEEGTFDVVTSINGIWGGCEPALLEAHRVLRPGGSIAISFWGVGPPLDIRRLFKTFAIHSPDTHRGSMRRLNDIATPGVAERMLTDAGFEVTARVACGSTIEWPDADTAWRAAASIGPAQPALRTNNAGELRREVLAALEPCRDEGGVYRLRSDLQLVVARN